MPWSTVQFMVSRYCHSPWRGVFSRGVVTQATRSQNAPLDLSGKGAN